MTSTVSTTPFQDIFRGLTSESAVQTDVRFLPGPILGHEVPGQVWLTVLCETERPSEPLSWRNWDTSDIPAVIRVSTSRRRLSNFIVLLQYSGTDRVGNPAHLHALTNTSALLNWLNECRGMFARVGGSQAASAHQLRAAQDRLNKDLPLFERLADTAAQDQGVDQLVRVLFSGAEDLTFESGYDNQFTNGLVALVEGYGEAALRAVADFAFANGAPEDALAEALKCLGRMVHPSSRSSRFQFLVRNLASNSPRLRDAAALGLAHMDDSRAVPYLNKAIEMEPIDELREDLRQVVRQLETNGL